MIRLKLTLLFLRFVNGFMFITIIMLVCITASVGSILFFAIAVEPGQAAVFSVAPLLFSSTSAFLAWMSAILLKDIVHAFNHRHNTSKKEDSSSL